MSMEELKAVMDAYPNLTAHGMGSPYEQGQTPQARQADLESWRQRLATDVVTFDKVSAWLGQHPEARIKSLNRTHSSYGWKHVAERALGIYVANGTFIAAALHQGFTMVQHPSGPNVFLNISEKFYKAMETA